jgi:hypothetical protein
MPIQIIPLPAAFVSKLRAAEAELYSVIENEEDGETISDLQGVIERLEEIILKIESPL